MMDQDYGALSTNSIEAEGKDCLRRRRMSDHAPPQHLAELEQDSDQGKVTDDWVKVRSERIFHLMQYNWIFLPLTLGSIYFLLYHYLKRENGGPVVVDRSLTWTLESVLFLILVLPSQPYWLMSAIGAIFPMRPFRNANRQMQRSFKRFIICLVTRGEQFEVVNQSVTMMQDLPAKLDHRMSLHILTEQRNVSKFQGRYHKHVVVHGVPESYIPPKAKYKARSLEWFRTNMVLQNEDWVLHLDEETVIDEYGLKACLDFVTRQTDADVGTGIIHYNSDGYWQHILPTVGDIGRVQADWGRLQFQANYLHHAELGIHGAFLLTNGAVENAATWDTDILTEDYWFLLQARKRGFRLGWVPGIAREISPGSIRDYIKQRRRWYSGIRQINKLSGRLVLISWSWILLQPVYWTICWMTNQSAAPKPHWFHMLMVFQFTYDKLFISLSVLLQDWDAGLSWTAMIRSQILAGTLMPFVSIIDSFAVLWALWAPEKGFFIIDKCWPAISGPN